ncbi:hypothetical protein BGX31_002906 [Mortierella sp. GBA43]|nr:hypothetical protein BGX31_002906 [Mortierella sp. GBA43]
MPDKPLPSGEDYMRHFVNSLKTSIQTDHSFYPPILIAHGLHALVAQKYVESHPVSALVLVSPFIPELIKERFQRLSYALDHDQDVPETEAVDPLPVQPDEHEASQEEEITTEADDGAEIEDDGDDDDDEDDGWMAYDFKTHADVAAHEGFRERYILPKKAVYKIDQIGKEHQETERKERQEKERIAQHERAKEAGTDDSSSSGPVKLGKDSLPVQEDSASLDVNGDSLPEQTVESEASIRSPLEKLPLNIYDSISETIFEPTFPILLVTCNGDEIVSTDDVKEHHDLAGLVDHIELDDLDDGGHLIMVSDNTEWEQGIQGITAWLDSNGM